MIVVLGPTATGKTSFAARLAHSIGGEIISADSRQVYRGMDIGTGKDYSDYIVDGKKIRHHLIDIAEPGMEYSVFNFRKDFRDAYNDIVRRGKVPVLCGGSGMYIESVLKGYRLTYVPRNEQLRKKLRSMPHEDLVQMLKDLRPVHNITDTEDPDRLIRAIEIGVYYRDHPMNGDQPPRIDDYVLLGIRFERGEIRERIRNRLHKRLREGMVDEVESLLSTLLQPEQLRFYGLEYRYVTDHLTGKLSHEEMAASLETAIHRFAKRQSTWFRKMEREGFAIHWIDGHLSMEKKIETALGILQDEAYDFSASR